MLAVSATVAATASAHPGAPWRSVAWAQKTQFGHYNTGPYRIVKAVCTGISPSSHSRFRHFRCVTTRKDGERFSQVIHSTSDGEGWAFSDTRHLGPGPSNKQKVIGSATGSGDYATAVASGNVNDPYVINVVATASPDQRIDVDWTAVCVRTNSSGGIGSGSKSGHYSDYSGPAHQITLPMANPDSCTVGATASLSGSGRVKVTIVAIIRS